MTKGDKTMRIISIVIMFAFMMLGAFFIGYLASLIALVVWILIDRLYFKKIELDYDYELHNQNLTFSTIRNGQGRENVISINLVIDADIIAPKNSSKIADVKPDHFYIYSPLVDESKTYAILLKKDEKLHCLLFDPDEEMLHCISNFTGNRLVKE
ncbi:MAG: hypothetical protein MJ087_04040 [Lachnospiraceae bacterium]|nr:hypothetical protein [Lachnospiraceae bacterium]